MPLYWYSQQNLLNPTAFCAGVINLSGEATVVPPPAEQALVISGEATVIVKKVFPIFSFDNDPTNLFGVFAIVPSMCRNYRYRFIEIVFKHKDVNIIKEFYTEKQISIDIKELYKKSSARPPKVSLGKIEGMVEKRRRMEKMDLTWKK